LQAQQEEAVEHELQAVAQRTDEAALQTIEETARMAEMTGESARQITRSVTESAQRVVTSAASLTTGFPLWDMWLGMSGLRSIRMSRITLSDGLLIAEVDGLPSSASRRAVGIVGSGSSDAPSLIKRCAVRSGHQGPVLAVLAMLATKRRLRVAPRGCALPLTAAAHGAL
jgi:hypothetical protein